MYSIATKQIRVSEQCCSPSFSPLHLSWCVTVNIQYSVQQWKSQSECTYLLYSTYCTVSTVDALNLENSAHQPSARYFSTLQERSTTAAGQKWLRHHSSISVIKLPPYHSAAMHDVTHTCGAEIKPGIGLAVKSIWIWSASPKTLSVKMVIGRSNTRLS